jgi:hypothetical protein
MNPYANPPVTQKWCHVVCTWSRRRKLLKIPATARFCERFILSSRILPSWVVAAALVTPSQVRLLVRLHAGVTRTQVLRAVRRAVAQSLRKAGVIPRWQPVFWGESSWCFVLRNATAVAAVRRHMAERNATVGTLFPLPTTAETVAAFNPSVGQDLPGRINYLLRLRQDKILERGRIR